MTVELRKWIQKNCGIYIKPDTYYLKNQLSDGVLIAQILFQHNVITYEQFTSVETTMDHSIAIWNFLVINTWLRKLDLKLTTEEILDITESKGDAGEKLLAALKNKFENNVKSQIYPPNYINRLPKSTKNLKSNNVKPATKAVKDESIKTKSPDKPPPLPKLEKVQETTKKSTPIPKSPIPPSPKIRSSMKDTFNKKVFYSNQSRIKSTPPEIQVLFQPKPSKKCRMPKPDPSEFRKSELQRTDFKNEFSGVPSPKSNLVGPHPKSNLPSPEPKYDPKQDAKTESSRSDPISYVRKPEPKSDIPKQDSKSKIPKLHPKSRPHHKFNLLGLEPTTKPVPEIEQPKAEPLPDLQKGPVIDTKTMEKSRLKIEFKLIPRKTDDFQSTRHYPSSNSSDSSKCSRTNKNLHNTLKISRFDSDESIISDYTYQELRELEKQAQLLPKFEPDPDVAAKIIQDIKVRRKTLFPKKRTKYTRKKISMFH